VVQHGKTGVVTYTNNPDSLAWGILEVLNNPAYAQILVENAYRDLDLRFSWSMLAKETEMVYDKIIEMRSQIE
jgi:glycosyltransferase involved in cell wall biosynthesis